MAVVEVDGYKIEPRANLYGANLDRADLGQAVADEDTRWPEGFDPVAAGVDFE